MIDEGSINAFTTGGGYVYVHRGLLAYLNSEAELAAVLGHELAHVTARHPARGQTRSVLANILAMGAAIVTGSAPWPTWPASAPAPACRATAARPRWKPTASA